MINALRWRERWCPNGTMNENAIIIKYLIWVNVHKYVPVVMFIAFKSLTFPNYNKYSFLYIINFT